jgi:hypothetical protein
VNNVVAFNATMGIRSFFPDWVLRPEKNEAYSNVGFGNPQGDFSTFQGGIDFSNGNVVADPLFVDLAVRDCPLASGQSRDRSRDDGSLFARPRFPGGPTAARTDARRRSLRELLSTLALERSRPLLRYAPYDESRDVFS